jgi:hypothetical protein
MEQVKSADMVADRSANYFPNPLARLVSALRTLVDVKGYRDEIARYERELGRKGGSAGER